MPITFKTYCFKAALVGALCAAVLATAAPAFCAEGRFGNALAASKVFAKAPGLPAMTHWPITVECWAKVSRFRGYNVLVASQYKRSLTHWEIFANDGSLTDYVPSTDPGQRGTAASIADNKWHYLAMVLEEGRTRLYVDGKLGLDFPTKRSKFQAAVETGPLVIGDVCEGGIPTTGWIDEVRVSGTAREIKGIPDAPFGSDEHTLALYHFDEPAGAAKFADSSPMHNDAAASSATGAGPDLMAPEPDLETARAALKQALDSLKLPALAKAGDTRDALLRDWLEHYYHLDRQIHGAEGLPPSAAKQVFDPQAMIQPGDRDPLDVVLRRSGALLEHLKAAGAAMGPLADELSALRTAAAKLPPGDTRQGLFLTASALQREIAFANPLVDFDRILFVAHGVYGGSRKDGPKSTYDSLGQHFNTQYFGFNAVPGGGLFVARNFKTQPQVENLLKDSLVQSGRLTSQKLVPGAFLSPDLSYDGKSILFAYTQATQHLWEWNEKTAYHIFEVGADGRNLRRLTDGAWDDFDPVYLPGGRIAFLSERRGGYIRCFSGLPVRTHVLHSMKADGSDIFPLSYFETSEWHPSVDNNGMIVYTRWDYTDRENCLGSNFWTCFPDGRNPRAPHGNYPFPWQTFADNTLPDSRRHRPYTEMSIRAVPHSSKYILTAAPHHGEAYGSLCMLDLHLPDDGDMMQLRRITPYALFPETELPARGQYAYGTPWPLNEDFYLCNWWENLYLLDRFGNQVLLVENSLACGGQTNYDLRLIDPIPLRARPMPPAIPTQTNQGAGARGDAPAARISVMNVYRSDMPFPKGTKIKYLRVLQAVLKLNPEMGSPMIGYQNENTPRIPLGIVPVEDDGSAYFEAPVQRQLIFQALDENFMAVQSMRAVAYVHPGEHLTCQGCHEGPDRSPAADTGAQALNRPPSKLQPEIGPVEPISYYRTVRPIFEKSCAPCHQKSGKGPAKMDYGSLRDYVFYFAGGMSGSTVLPIHGGSRTIPGRFGARASKMGQAMLSAPHKEHVSREDYRKIVLWIDANSLQFTAFDEVDKQLRGELVWPTLDVDPNNPQGLEKPRK